MASKPSFMEILKTAKNIQGQVASVQKEMESRTYAIKHEWFEGTIGGNDLIQSLHFLPAAEGVALEALATALVAELNGKMMDIKKENKTKMENITKDMLPNGIPGVSGDEQ